MSSFVISKTDYTKAAAFLAAGAATMTYFREPVIDIRTRKSAWRPYGDTEILADFDRLHDLNVHSVCEQYHTTPGEAPGEIAPAVEEALRETFRHHRRAGVQLYRNGYTLRTTGGREQLRLAVHGLICFFRSVQYQIEDEDDTRKALNILNKYYRALYAVLAGIDMVTHEDTQPFWGSFDPYAVVEDEATA